jgi:SAM-dependent methyltransferase
MPTDHTQPIAEWNGPQGERGPGCSARTDAIVRGVRQTPPWPPPRRSSPKRVVDIGCGCGDTSIELARRVGASGRVLGVDGLATDARGRPLTALRFEPLLNLSFREADASSGELLSDTDCCTRVSV